MRATPRPWHVYDRGVGYEVHAGPPTEHHWWRGGEHGHEKSGECYCIHDGFRETIPNEADAELIVRAVNRDHAFDALVEALAAMVAEFLPEHDPEIIGVFVRERTAREKLLAYLANTALKDARP